MDLRPPRDDDLDDFDAMADILGREIREGVAHFGTEPESASALAAEWREGRYPWLVAEEQGGIAGFARAGAWKARGAYAWTVEVGVYVRPARQGRGVGRALCEALLAALRASGYRAVVAGIALPNPASVRLLESLGLRPAGVLPAVGFKHGRWIDVGYWTLRLGGDEPPAALG